MKLPAKARSPQCIFSREPDRGIDNVYRGSAQVFSVVCSNRVWNFVRVVFVLYAGTRLDVSFSRQMVSSFSGSPIGSLSLRVEQFDMLHYTGMSIFKIGIILLNLVPYIALHICRRNMQS